jgi:hypothetical protein
MIGLCVESILDHLGGRLEEPGRRLPSNLFRSSVLPAESLLGLELRPQVS